MLKVTFCTYDKPGSVGGPFSWLQRLLPSLRHHGIEPRCLFLLHHGESGPVLESFISAGIACDYRLCGTRTDEQVRWVLERLRDNPPDIFVPNLPVAAYYASCWIRAAGIPTLGILHSDDPYYRALQEEFVFGLAKFQLSGLVCVSKELEGRAMTRHPRATQIFRIPYGVSVPHFRVARQLGVLRIAFVGRLAEEQKRISDVTRALCRVVREVPGTSAVIYGDGPDRASVEGVLALEGAGLSVRLAGRVSNETIQSQLLECDVIVLLSDYEGLPIALMEAMACGCVPVCTRMRSGIPELVEDGVTGLLVEDRGDSFIAAIRRLQDEPILWQRLSAAAKAHIRDRFSDTVCDSMWAAILHRLAKSSGPKCPLVVPSRIRLPRRNPALETPDRRVTSPSFFTTSWRKLRKTVGRMKRRFWGGCSFLA